MAEELHGEFGMCPLAADLIPPLSSPASHSSRRGEQAMVGDRAVLCDTQEGQEEEHASVDPLLIT